MEDMKEKYENFKEQVRSQADIVRVVSQYVDLKKKGGRYWGCCPFHGEKTPSFTVDEGKGLFHCFGCGVGGDVFTFVMKEENVTFPEALKFLANKFNIPIPEREKTPGEIARDKEAKEIYGANELAAQFFRSCLINTTYGHTGIAYLAGRGITREIIDQFGLGMAPPDFNKLHQALEKKGIREDIIVKAGLANRREKGGVYDKFRGRIMIPIRDARGRVVGFTGRILDKEASPAKYMNTGDTPWFHKGNILFGLDTALKAIRTHKQVVVVEGHMDAISLHAAGIDWSVASMGTAFTEKQAEMIKRLAPEVVFSFDSDSAGKNAALRAIPIAMSLGLKAKIMHVTDGKDPDDYVRKHGKTAFQKLIDGALPGIDYEVESTLAVYNTGDLAGKVEAVSHVLPFFLDCKSDIEVGERIRNLSRRLTIDEGLIQSEYRKILNKKRHEDYIPPVTVTRPKVANATEQAERHVIFALLAGISPKRSNYNIGEEIFTGEARKEIFAKLQEKPFTTPKEMAAGLFEVLSSDGASELTNILQLDLPTESLPVILADCLHQLQLAALEREFQQHSKLASEYEKAQNNEFLQELEICQRIKNEIKALSLNQAVNLQKGGNA